MGVGLASTRSWNLDPVTPRVAVRASLRSQQTRVRFRGANNYIDTVVGCPEGGHYGQQCRAASNSCLVVGPSTVSRYSAGVPVFEWGIAKLVHECQLSVFCVSADPIFINIIGTNGAKRLPRSS